MPIFRIKWEDGMLSSNTTNKTMLIANMAMATTPIDKMAMVETPIAYMVMVMVVGMLNFMVSHVVKVVVMDHHQPPSQNVMCLRMSHM
jgi:hypothetical protein